MTEMDELLDAGEALYARLREVRDYFAPDEETRSYEDEGWASVDATLAQWRRVQRRVRAG